MTQEPKPLAPVLNIIWSKLTPEEIRCLRLESLERAVVRNLPPSKSDFRREDIYDDDEGR